MTYVNKDTKVLRVNYENWSKLNLLKATRGFRTVNDTIAELFKKWEE